MLGGALLALAPRPLRDRAWLALPLGLYAGWLTAASCVALATVVAGYGLGKRHGLSWIGVLLALLIIAVTATQRLRVPTYPLAVAWALAGIVAANATVRARLRGRGARRGSRHVWLALKVLRPAS
jgi:hypothetical protein